MDNYKLKVINTYTSTEWLANGTKKYRKVFLAKNVDYLYFEVVLHNLKFQIVDWVANFKILCYKKEKGANRRICDLDFEKLVSADDAVFELREGWGNAAKGKFWQKGEYFWEVQINNKIVGLETFFIEDIWDINDDIDEYLSLENVYLTEGDKTLQEYNLPHYKYFDSNISRYIYANLQFANNYLFDGEARIEVFLRFYTSTRELKGVVSKILKITGEDELIEVNLGWGSSGGGSWYPGEYFIDIVIFEQAIATVKFEVGKGFEEGDPEVFFPGDITPKKLNADKDDLDLEVLMKNLDELVGLEEIKNQIKNHAKYIRFINLRKEKGFKEEEDIDIHMVFMGNPGTGKTTVAGMMGMLYKKMGILSKGHVHSVDRVDLIGEYIGQTAPKVKAAIEKAKGGVLFIDEAYSLARDNSDSKDFGREVIEILVKEMSDGDGDIVVIAAGYPKEMKYFINSNPGLKSRFKLFYNFPDYLPQELSQIAEFAALKKEVKFSKEAKIKLDDLIVKAFRNRDETFGNARFVFDLVEKAKINMALRLMKKGDVLDYNKDKLELIELVDVEKLELEKTKTLPNIPIDEELLKEAMSELNDLIGLEKVKQEIIETIGVVRYHLERGRNVLNNFYLHTVFVGNPGTGKTTVARILTKIYKALGILERGHMVETDRQGLVAGFIGQTAIKTAKKIDEAMGGVLFIDEAYSLSPAFGHNDYGSEVIQTILKRMEDNRGQFFVFAAGYPENMESFLKSNPGLKSRFDKILKFEDYSVNQLADIARFMLDQMEMAISDKAFSVLYSYLKNITSKKDRYFGNARKVRKIVTEIVENQNIRISSMPKSSRESIDIHLIDSPDVEKAIREDKIIFEKKNIGFKPQSSRG